MTQFQKSLKVGEVGEEAVKRIFTNLWPRYTLVDVRDNPEYQRKDIDFLYLSPMRFVGNKSIEVKTDTVMARTGNIYLECMDNCNTGRKGWFYASEADYLCYYDYHNDELYVIELAELRWLVKRVPTREVVMRDYNPATGYYKEGRGLVMKKEELTKAESYYCYTGVMRELEAV